MIFKYISLNDQNEKLKKTTLNLAGLKILHGATLHSTNFNPNPKCALACNLKAHY